MFEILITWLGRCNFKPTTILTTSSKKIPTKAIQKCRAKPQKNSVPSKINISLIIEIQHAKKKRKRILDHYLFLNSWSIYKILDPKRIGKEEYGQEWEEEDGETYMRTSFFFFHIINYCTNLFIFGLLFFLGGVGFWSIFEMKLSSFRVLRASKKS